MRIFAKYAKYAAYKPVSLAVCSAGASAFDHLYLVVFKFGNDNILLNGLYHMIGGFCDEQRNVWLTVIVSMM